MEKYQIEHRDYRKDVIFEYECNSFKECVEQAVLKNISLLEADLSGKDLSGCNLAGAKLVGADLVKTNFCEANLQRADFRNSKEYKTDFYRAIFWAADIRGCFFNEGEHVHSIFDNIVFIQPETN